MIFVELFSVINMYILSRGFLLWKNMILSVYIYVCVFKTDKIKQFYVTFCFTAFSIKKKHFQFSQIFSLFYTTYYSVCVNKALYKKQVHIVGFKNDSFLLLLLLLLLALLLLPYIITIELTRSKTTGKYC